MKIAVLFYNIGHYHLARLNAAASALNEAGGKLSAIQITGETSEHPWGSVELPSYVSTIASKQKGDRPALSDPGCLYKSLENVRPDVVAIPGWGFDFSRFALRWCQRHDVAAVLMSESHSSDTPRMWVKEFVKKWWWIPQFDSALVGGTKHREYLASLGFPKDRIFFGYDVVDNPHIEKVVDEIRRDDALTVRPAGFPARPFVLCSGRFIARKNIECVIRAFLLLKARCSRAVDWELVILGDGELRDRLHSVANDSPFARQIHFPGFKTYQEVLFWYAYATVFVHSASAEQWGLVVNEAMAAGLPVIVSRTCGCVPGLVHEGRNGFTFDPSSEEGLCEVLEKLVEEPQLRSQMGQQSRQLIHAKFTPKAFANGLMAAAQSALTQRSLALQRSPF